MDTPGEISSLLLSLYLGWLVAAFVLSSGHLASGGRWRGALLLALTGGVALSTLALGVRWYEAGQVELAARLAVGIAPVGLERLTILLSHPPFTNLFEIMLYMAWALGLTALLVERRLGVRAFAVLATGAAVLCLGVALLGLDGTISPLVPALQSWWLHLHVFVATLSYAAAAGAAFASLLYLIADGLGGRALLAGGALLQAFAALALRGWDRLLDPTVAVRLLKDGQVLHVPGPQGGSQPVLVDLPGLHWWLVVALAASLAVLAIVAVTRREPCRQTRALYALGLLALLGFIVHLVYLLGDERLPILVRPLLAAGVSVAPPFSLGFKSAPWAMALAVSALAGAAFCGLAVVRRHWFELATVSTEQLDALAYRLVGVTFPTLTLVLVTGSVWAHHAWGRFWSWDPKETWSLVAWLVYAFYLHARLRRDWRGRPLALVALVALAVIIFTFLGVNLGLSGGGLHVYGAG